MNGKTTTLLSFPALSEKKPEKISGNATVPRLSVFRSNKQIYAQVIDDISGKTIAEYFNISNNQICNNGKSGNLPYLTIN